jgi:hypothetical protein
VDHNLENGVFQHMDGEAAAVFLAWVDNGFTEIKNILSAGWRDPHANRQQPLPVNMEYLFSRGLRGAKTIPLPGKTHKSALDRDQNWGDTPRADWGALDWLEYGIATEQARGEITHYKEGTRLPSWNAAIQAFFLGSTPWETYGLDKEDIVDGLLELRTETFEGMSDTLGELRAAIEKAVNKKVLEDLRDRPHAEGIETLKRLVMTIQLVSYQVSAHQFDYVLFVDSGRASKKIQKKETRKGSGVYDYFQRRIPTNKAIAFEFTSQNIKKNFEKIFKDLKGSKVLTTSLNVDPVNKGVSVDFVGGKYL